MIQSLNELEQALDTQDRLVLKISTPTCAPCKQIKKTFDKIKSEVEYTMIEVEIGPQTPEDLREYVISNLNVTGVPAFRVYNEGGLVNAFAGMQTEADLKTKFEVELN